MYPGDSRLFNDCSRRKTANYRDRSDKDDRGLVDSSLALILAHRRPVHMRVDRVLAPVRASIMHALVKFLLGGNKLMPN